MTPLEDLLKQCTVKITLPGGWGTGFFVAPGLILTCAHVVRKATDWQVTIFYPAWQQPLSAIVKAKADDGKTLDLALVELAEPLSEHPCVLLDEEPVAIGQALYSYGYLESYINAAPVRPVNEGLTGDTPPLLKLQGAQIEKGISGAALLNLKTGKVCGMVKETRAAGFDLGGGAIPTRVILEQFPELRSLQQAFHEKDRRWINLITPPGIDFQPYLQAILVNEDYREWQEVYTPTTVEDRRRMPEQETPIASQRRFSSRLKLRAEIVKPDKQEQGDQPNGVREPQERVEQWDVLAGLRNYAVEHVVLSGKPGSGKSTSLERLLWEEAEKALQNPNARIPVLVKLRRCNGTIEGLIRDFLVGHQIALEIAQIEELLRQGKFLLLLDGLNELPKAFETEVANFRDRYRRTTPVIVSTRDLGGGDTLGIEKTLKMLPLTEPQMREFVPGYLGEEGDRLFQQLQGDRLRKFAETPLLLWMLCRVFAEKGKVPDNLGLAFREFAQLHDQELQADVPANSRDQWHRLLRYLAFVMMQGKTAIDPQLSIPREEAEDCLTAYLRQEDRSNPRECAEQWLKDLLKYHLIQPVIQPNFEEHIEFRHQLIQEYYAAEYLLKLLPTLTDDQLKRNYLNYLKWTEPISLMLALEDKVAQALRVVKLALDEVDLVFGASLAGEVKPEFQAQTVKFVEELDVPDWLKVQLLGETKAESAISILIKFLNHSDVSLRQGVVWALGGIDSAQAVALLIQLLDDPAISVRKRAITVLGEINSVQAVDALIQVSTHGETILSSYAADILAQALKNQSPTALHRIGKILINLDMEKSTSILNLQPIFKSLKPESGKIESEESITQLIQALNDSHPNVRQAAAKSLGKIGSEQAITPLIQTLSDLNSDVRRAAAKSLGKIGSEQAITPLTQTLSDLNSDVRRAVLSALLVISSEQAIAPLIQALDDSSPDVRQFAAIALRQNFPEQAITPLIQALEDSNPDVRQAAAKSLGKIGSEQAITPLTQTLSDLNSDVRRAVLSALLVISSEQAIAPSIQALEDSSPDVRQFAAIALGKIGSEQAITPLLQALEDSSPDVRQFAAIALGKIGSEQAITPLIQALEDSNPDVRQAAAKSLGKIGSEQAITPLLQALNDSNSNVYNSVLSALAKVRSDLVSEQTIHELVQTLNHDHPNIRQSALRRLTKIRSEQAIDALTQAALNHSYPSVRRLAAEALGKIRSEKAIHVLTQALGHLNPDVRENAAIALKNIGTEQAISKLMLTLVGPNSAEKMVVAKVLFEKRSEQLVIALKQTLSNLDSHVDEGESEPPRKINSEESISLLVKFIDHPVANERERAALALGKIGSTQANASLIRMMNDPVSFVRGSAARALGEIRSEQAVNTLIQALPDPVSGVRWRAAEALGNIASERSINPLIRALQDSDSVVRETVAEALGKIKGDKIAQQLPTLVKLLPGKGGQEVMLAISAIQTNCQFYNYEIFQAHLAEQKGDRQTYQNSDRPSTINQFPNVTEVKIFETVERCFDTPPPAKDPPS